MSKNLDGIVAAIRKRRSEKRPEVEKNLQKIDALLGALRDTRGRASDVADHHPDLKATLQSVSFKDAENRLLRARAACEAALTRLRRDSINIGVAAKAGQGKSKMLQMLTGLGDDQIPTGNAGACTAVRSIVHNSPFKKAVIHYLTPIELLEKKVYPSYEKADKTLADKEPEKKFAIGHEECGLKQKDKPNSLDEFLSAVLPTIKPATELPTQGVSNWNRNVHDLQRDLKTDPELKLLLGKAPEEVPMEDVRSFLVKDNKEKKHNVVAFVEMWTPFEVGLPEGLTVYDLPGLEDPTPGIRKDMLNSVKTDADVVFFLLKPPTNGERTLWKEEDNEAADMLQGVYPVDEVKPSDWVQLILNEDKREGHKNGASINVLLGKDPDGTPSGKSSTIPEGFAPVVCDCGKTDKVREMVDANIDALVNQAGRIDDLRIRQAGEAFSIAIGETRALYNALASNEVVAQDLGPKFFKTHWEKFKKDLKLPFRRQATPEDNATNDPLYPFSGLAQKVLEDHFKKARAKFKSIYEKNENTSEFPPELPVFSRERIENVIGGDDSDGVVDRVVRNQREAVLTFVRAELTKCCDDLMDQYFKKVVEIGLSGNSALKMFGSSGKTEVSRDRIESFLAAVRKSGRYPTIESAAECLRTFNLSFEDTILPGIYSTTALSDFDPDKSYEGAEQSSGNDESDEEREDDLRPIEMVKRHIKKRIPVGAADKRATYLFNWLKMKSNDIISFMASGPSDSAFSSIARYVASAMKANYDAFAFRFIYGDDCDSEWESLTRANQAVFWKDEYEAASANSKLAKDWQSALAGLAAALADAN